MSVPGRRDSVESGGSGGLDIPFLDRWDLILLRRPAPSCHRLHPCEGAALLAVLELLQGMGCALPDLAGGVRLHPPQPLLDPQLPEGLQALRQPLVAIIPPAGQVKGTGQGTGRREASAGEPVGLRAQQAGRQEAGALPQVLLVLCHGGGGALFSSSKSKPRKQQMEAAGSLTSR